MRNSYASCSGRDLWLFGGLFAPVGLFPREFAMFCDRKGRAQSPRYLAESPMLGVQGNTIAGQAPPFENPTGRKNGTLLRKDKVPVFDNWGNASKRSPAGRRRWAPPVRSAGKWFAHAQLGLREPSLVCAKPKWFAPTPNDLRGRAGTQQRAMQAKQPSSASKSVEMSGSEAGDQCGGNDHLTFSCCKLLLGLDL
jgi:hypothetical protein